MLDKIYSISAASTTGSATFIFPLGLQMDKMYLLAASLHYGPPDTTLQVPNLLSPSWDTTDEGRRVAWHGTTASGTLGIVTNGYKNGFGKGNEDRSNGYGLQTPGTHVATEESMGRGYR